MSAVYYDPMGKKGGEDEGEKERGGGDIQCQISVVGESRLRTGQRTK